METRATSLCRSGHVALGDGDASDLAVSLRSRRSGSLFASDLAESLRSRRSG
ncbi:hypothetical protein DY000_02063176 [Brassica cretica]|uniref:Uncharacterized protein n=1 Tax=Brassica cretica TaxID=69181 RepID=A0ABQ7B0E4_BRACR|nr:hypothetical protein DY000_02063176 [Brassica cretica]